MATLPKLSPEQIAEIRASNVSAYALAPAYGVSPATVQAARNGPVSKQCSCGETFTPKNSKGQKYCSTECRDEAAESRHLAWLEEQPTKKCPVCEQGFIPIKAHGIQGEQKFCSRECYRVNRREHLVCVNCGNATKPKCKFCSPECFSIWRAKRLQIQIRCPVCLNQFHTYRANPRRFCSRECYSVEMGRRQRGPKSHLWKGGRTSEAMRIRNSSGYGEWRRRVFERDEFTCQSCFTVGDRLTAHHVIPFSEDPRARLKVSNGVTLCWDCHRLFHRCSAQIGIKESTMRDAVEKFLDQEPAVWYYKVPGTVMGKTGIPDFLACVAGRGVALELKVHPNFPTQRQKHQIRRINEAGGIARVVRGVEEVEAIVGAIKEASTSWDDGVPNSIVRAAVDEALLKAA